MNKTRKVYKGYLIDINPFHHGLVRRVLVDKCCVFIPSYGWTSRGYIEENYKLILFPDEIDHVEWFDGWWTDNWKFNDWSWCYGSHRKPSFISSHVIHNVDGTSAVFST